MGTDREGQPVEPQEHPVFTRAKSLPEPWRSLLPHSPEQARGWYPFVDHRALAGKVLVAMTLRVECAWAAYIGDVPGFDHGKEVDEVLRHGTKLPEAIARVVFPGVPEGLPYAE